jgi:3'-phosphoadenosine 5'-phosphosulfate sulfotransferase (PAPS reductase)/FAD synthetase
MTAPTRSSTVEDNHLAALESEAVHIIREVTAATVNEVLAEVAASRITERGATRADDRLSEAAMEDRKREGYF